MLLGANFLLCVCMKEKPHMYSIKILELYEVKSVYVSNIEVYAGIDLTNMKHSWQCRHRLHEKIKDISLPCTLIGGILVVQFLILCEHVVQQ
jgi:hypothetical protein